MADKNVSERLQNYIIVYSALGILVVGVIVAFVSIMPLFNRLKKDQDRNLLFAAKTRTWAVEEYLSRAKDVALQITSRTKAREKLVSYNKGEVTRNEFVNFSEAILTDALKKSEEVLGITRLDQKGTLVVQVGVSIPEEFWPVPERESGETLIHCPITLGSESYLVEGAPILDRQSRRVGTDIVLFKLTRLQQIVGDYTGLGKTGETVLGVVRDNRVQLFFPLRKSKGGVSESFPKNSPLGSAFEKAFRKEVGILKLSENPEVIAYSPIQGSEWCIVVKMDKEELYAPVNRQVIVISSIIVILILLGTFGMVFLLRPLAGKMIIHADELQREIQEKTAVIAKEQSGLQEWINTFDTFVGKFDQDGVGIIFNETPIKAGGLTKDDVVGKYFPDTKWWSHSEIERAKIVGCFERAKTGLSSRIETNFRSADGTPVPIIFNCQPVMDDVGKVEYITAEGKMIVEEVKLRNALQEEKESLGKRVKERTSELVAVNEELRKEVIVRKEAEDHIQQLQSVLRAIRSVNQLIVRENNQQKLLQGACEILNQTRSYKLVWIGLIQEGTKDVLPVAQAGFEEEYLKSVKITWDDSETGKGPTGTAIKTNKPFVMRDIAGDPRYKPWREEAIKRGYASSSAIPLGYEDRVFGALNVYAAFPDAFDEEEIGLLLEVGQDIAFALHNIEVEEKRKRVEETLRKAHEEVEAKVAERTRELAQANIRLKEMDRLKSQFLATMSHELRTPLNSIIGFNGIVLKGIAGEINEEQKKQLSMAYSSAKHLLNLINDILDLSRIEAGKIEISVEKFKVEKVISQVAQTLSPMISQKRLRLLTEIPDEIPEIYSDRKKVLQILLNLVNNAVKFTDKGEIKIGCKIDNDNLEVCVSDTGIGIKRENMDYLFEAFRQVDGTARRRYQGTGLGLYLCKKLVTLLGGEIWAESKYGKGSKFSFVLPLRFKTREQHEKKDIGGGR